MTSIKISQNPTFKMDVKIPRVGSDPVTVPFEFKYRDRVELAALFDGWDAKSKALQERFVGKTPTLAEISEAQIDLQTEQISDLVTGWGFEDPFSEESIRTLVKACVGVPDAIIEAHAAAYSTPAPLSA